MSSTEMYLVDGDGDVVHWREFKNSHGGAAAIWSVLTQHYLKLDAYAWCEQRVLDRLFDAAPRMDPIDRVVLLSTDDDVMVKRDDVPSLADAFDAFYDRWKAQRVGMVFSLREQAAAMREALEHEDTQGICWNQTSVNESPWYEPMPGETIDGEFGGESYEEIVDEDDCEWGYNINVHTKHEWLDVGAVLDGGPS